MSVGMSVGVCPVNYFKSTYTEFVNFNVETIYLISSFDTVIMI